MQDLTPIRSQMEPVPPLLARFLQWVASSFRLFGTPTARYQVARFLHDHPVYMQVVIEGMLAAAGSELMLQQEDAEDAMEAVLTGEDPTACG